MDVATLLLELGAVLLVLAVAARIAHRLGLSPIPLYLLVGLALGQGGLYPLITAETFIQAGAEIGVVLLLLMLGLEYSSEELLGGLRTGLPAAAADLVLNFTPGLVAGLALGWSPTAAIVLAGVTYISSSGIAAKMIDDRGWLANRETPLVLSLLVAEDLVMAAYLPLVGALLAGGGVVAVTGTLAAGLGAATTALLVALRFGDRLSGWIHSTSREALLLGVLGATLLVAGAAERVHISAAVGAFFVGIAVSGPVQSQARELLGPVRDLFAATFFVLFGLMVDPRDIPPVLPLAALLAGVTAATKVATVRWGFRSRDLGPQARRRAGAVLAARGEFSIVIAELGVAGGLEPMVGSLAATYVLLLATGAPVLARALRL